ncbi:hypothetical protein BU23DRAFT_311326 [Bimuria novae-zelandiae CBS 107.79]|uniref:Uncharacterized protein n=1 Tax=Bimuria novae-zelandiae CBS 107.79 TaxID=1447943 RepID=A0A6A5UPZ7_9PLEO|nr:hypothetical protein BU23DRAFT_311326 [Bimuria novae-zelandiae CBS 107.79]
MATVSSRSKFFSWGSKGARQQSTQEPYYRTGGLLPIDTSAGDEDQFLQTVVLDETKDTTWRRNPKNLSIVPPDYITSQSPENALQNDNPVKSAPNLLTFFTDSYFTSKHFAPASSKHSPSPSPALPAELPGDFPPDDQGTSATPTPDADRISLPSSAVTSVRSMFSLSSENAKSNGPTKVPQHRRSANDLRRRSKTSRPSLIASPSSTNSRITTISALSGDNANSTNPTKARVGPNTIVEGEQWKNGEDGANQPTASRQASATRTKQIDELKATITAQDQTISTLQSQFANLRASQEAHISSLVNAHSLELSSLKDYAKSLESQQRGLHHASSNHILFMLDTTDNPLSPNLDSPFGSAGSTPAGSIKSSRPKQDNPRSPLRSRITPEMENLKKQLSMAKRPDIGNGDVVRELKAYKRNNEALQKQVESLMAKLNQSEEEGRKQKRALQEVQKTSDKWQERASKNEELEKSNMALQNTMDHLEYRLQIANIDKVDAEEQMLNMRLRRTPFDPASLPKIQVPDNRQSTRTSMSTVFANESPISQHENEPTTLTAFISHIERLQEQVRQKDAHIAELEAENDQLKQHYGRLQGEHRELNLQSDIQIQLLKKTKQHEIHIEELRTAIIKREAMIGEKSKALQQAERQLEHHKLLLTAEIRRHASFALRTDSKGYPLPELSSLASKEDIDRWIERLQTQLNKEKADKLGQKAENESAIEALRRENEFYIREIIYYKLDCRGYKSDIKQLKKAAAKLGGHESRPNDMVSPDPSVCTSADTPEPTQLLSIPSNIGASTSQSPVSSGRLSVAIPLTQRMTPPPTELTPDPSPIDKVKRTVRRVPVPLQFDMPLTPCTPPLNPANEVDNIDPGISPRSVAKLSLERRKPTPPSPDQERFGELATHFPLSTPASPRRHDRPRSFSDSVVDFSFRSSVSSSSLKGEFGIIPIATRERSGSVPQPPRGKVTPERPPRPRGGLFDGDAYSVVPLRLQRPPRVDVMAEAMRNSPDHTVFAWQNATRQPFASSSFRPTASVTEADNRSSISTAHSPLPAPLHFRSRENPSSPSTAPPRKPSNSSTSSIPFVIAMGSPHNPALTACSITGKRTVLSPTLCTGIGNTMASTTPPVTSPVPNNTPKRSYFNAEPDKGLPARSVSLSSSFAKPTAASMSRTMAHARSISASSIRARIGSIKGRGKARTSESRFEVV